MQEEERLEASLKEYRTQLETVELALTQNADDSDLLGLKSSIQEVIQLTEENLLSVKKQRLLSDINSQFSEENTSESGENSNATKSGSDIQKEFEKFQRELGESSSKEESKEESKSDAELSLLISELEGKKCRAPYVQAWGQHSHQNAFVMSVEVGPDQGVEHLEDLQLRVLFCNPFCDGMKPCPYFLDGECRFEEDNCRFSHGYLVKLIDLQEFQDPDYSVLDKGCSCLAKYSDGLWYPAVVDDCLEEHTFVVTYNKYNESATLKIEDIVPIDQDESSSDDSDNDDPSLRMPSDNESDGEDTPSVLWLSINGSQQPIGEWEKHTRGIASKLMEKMGYVWGQGLGKNADGRLDPIQALVFPQGKSLDKCMELREAGAIQDPMKRKKTKKNAEKIAAGYHAVNERKNVFDFLNNKLSNYKNKQQKPSGSKVVDCVKKEEVHQLKEKSNRALNIGSLQLTEEMRRAQRELEHLHHSLTRNKNKDKVMTSQIEAKIVSKKELISRLKSQEKIIQSEQQTRKNHRKLSVF